MRVIPRRRRTTPRAALATTALAVALTSLAVVPTANAVVEYTQWDMRGDYGDYILGPTAYSYDAADGFEVEGGIGGVSAGVDAGGDWWNLTVNPADGDVLEAGRTYTGATRAPFAGPTEPGLSLSGSGRGCNTLTGSFTINEITVDLDGVVTALNLTFEQHCEGGAMAAYGSLAWHSSLPPAALPPTITGPSSINVKITPRKAVYGAKVELRARLTASSDVRTMTIYQKVGSGEKTLVATAAAGADGVLTRTLRVTGHTKYTVVYDGPGRVPDASGSANVSVTADLDTQVARASGKQGKYHLIAPGKRTFFLTRVLPKSPKACLGFRAQYLVRGGWGYDGVIRCVRLTSKSVAGVYFDWTRQLVGIPIRVRAEWRDNAETSGTRTPWTYLRMVNGRVVAPRSDGRSLAGTVAVPLPG